MPNIQPPEKVSRLEQSLSVHSIFRTIQGEGPFAGLPAIFIRLAGCNLQCPGCDTDYTSGRETLTAAEVAAAALAQAEGRNIQLIVITGGEPFRQARGLHALIDKLWDSVRHIQIETNGTIFPDPDGMLLQRFFMFGSRLTIVCSPKTGKVNLSIQALMDISGDSAFKYVMRDGDVSADDGLPLFALGHPAQPRLARPLLTHPSRVYLQPMDEGDEYNNRINLMACVNSCLKYGYRLSLQTHKIVGVP